MQREDRAPTAMRSAFLDCRPGPNASKALIGMIVAAAASGAGLRKTRGWTVSKREERPSR